MAFSETFSRTTFDTRKVIDHAMRRCKIGAQQITSEHIDIANDQLYLLLKNLANKGVQLWCIEKMLIPIYDGRGDVTLDQKVVDILNSNLRTLTEVTGTNSDDLSSRTVVFDSSSFISTVGVTWSAASAPLEFARSDDGVTWEVVQTDTPSAVAGETSWFDMESSVASTQFRVRATVGQLHFDSIFLGTNPSEIPLYRMNRDDYTNLPNKVFQSDRPLQFWFDRQVRQPVMHLYPVPNSSASYRSLIVAWAHRYIMDVGTMTQEIEVPERWYEAVVAGLARKLAREIPEVDPARIPMLDTDYGEALNDAQTEERDNSPIYIRPNIGMYTR